MSRLPWPLRAMIGPWIWAIGFSAVYALHGWGCARGWPQIPTPFGDLQGLVLTLVFLATLAAGAAGLVLTPRGRGVERTVVLAGGWLGMAGTALTLFPVLGLTTCS